MKHTCKECGKTFEEDLERLVEKVHTHFHEDHGKHISERKIRRQIKNGD